MTCGLQRVLALSAVVLAIILLPSCGNKEQLVSITVTPSEATFLGLGAQVQLTATGNFIYPSGTKDLTSVVSWSTDSPTVMTVSKTGLVTGINVCGSGNAIATAFSNPANPSAGSAIRGSAHITIQFEGGGGCPVTLDVLVSGNGRVTSAPGGIDCGISTFACSAIFPAGTPVTLTAAPNPGATFASWVGCDSTSTTNGVNTCTVALSADRQVSGTFN